MIKIDTNLVCDLYTSGSSRRQLERLFKCSQGPIMRILKNNNIKIRNRGCWDRKNYNRHTLIFDYFNNIDSDEKAYWLGYITSDGTISKDNYRVSLTSKDLEIIEKFKRCINATQPISTVISYDEERKKTYTRYLIQINSKEFVSYLLKHGVTNEKSCECNFPTEIINKKLIPSYLRGLFDGDGSVSKVSEKSIRISFIATRTILNYIQKFLLKLKIKKHPIYNIMKHKSKKYKMYQTHYFKDSMKILNIIYENSKNEVRLNRKYNIYKSMSEHKIKPMF